MKPLQDCQANVQSEFLSLTITVKGKGGETIKIKPGRKLWQSQE